jgi:hypothetical protein
MGNATLKFVTNSAGWSPETRHWNIVNSKREREIKCGKLKAVLRQSMEN